MRRNMRTQNTNVFACVFYVRFDSLSKCSYSEIKIKKMDKIEQIVKNIDRYDCIIALASVVAAQQLYSEFKSSSERFFFFKISVWFSLIWFSVVLKSFSQSAALQIIPLLYVIWIHCFNYSLAFQSTFQSYPAWVASQILVPIQQFRRYFQY